MERGGGGAPQRNLPSGFCQLESSIYVVHTYKVTRRPCYSFRKVCQFLCLKKEDLQATICHRFVCVVFCFLKDIDQLENVWT
jgi:hypothetical protein